MADDGALLERWNAGDASAGEALFTAYFDALYRFFRNKAPDQCEELVQSTFAACVEKRHTLRDAGSFRAFLYGIARFELMRLFRRKARHGQEVDLDKVTVHDLDPSPSRIAADKQEHRLLLEALRRIPVDLQIVVELHYWEKLRTAEIAHVIGVPEGTVKSRLRRAREAIAAVLPVLATDKAMLQSTVDGYERWVAGVRDLVSPDRAQNAS